jgi:hypothetical protein
MCALAIGRRHHVHSQPAPAVSTGSGKAGDDATLERIQRRYPRWLIWRGSVTGDYWAMPPRDHPTRRELISARDLGELAQRLARTEQQYDLLGHPAGLACA